MRINNFFSVVLPLLLCVSQPTEASFIGAAVRATRAGAAAGAAARNANVIGALSRGAASNLRQLINFPAGRVVNTIKDRAAAIRTAYQASTEGKKFLKYGLTGSLGSGTLSGTISGNISKNSKRRRVAVSDRARMLSNELNSRQEEGEVAEPGGAPEGIDQSLWDLCFWDLSTAANVVFSGEVDWIQIDGLPPACAEVNNRIFEIPESGAGLSCGDGCIRYEGLDTEDFDIMADYLNGFVTT